MRIIRFRRLSRPPQIVQGIKIWHWEIALSEEDLFEKLGGEMAEVIMPAKPWYIRLWRVFFPMREHKSKIDA
jgi:hypothetical protein